MQGYTTRGLFGRQRDHAFFDGLGRPLQNGAATGDSGYHPGDIVAPVFYDAFGGR